MSKFLAEALTHRERMLRWILALEGKSDKHYKQTIEMLRNEDGFCCLGVACDLYDPTKWEEKDGDNPRHNPIRFMGGDDSELPLAVALWYGLEQDPLLTGVAKADAPLTTSEQAVNPDKKSVKKGERVTLRASVWNDQQDYSFKEIAAMLREKYDIHEQEEAK